MPAFDALLAGPAYLAQLAYLAEFPHQTAQVLLWVQVAAVLAWRTGQAVVAAQALVWPLLAQLALPGPFQAE